MSTDQIIEQAAADAGNATALVGAVIDGKARIVEMPTAKAMLGLRLPARLERDDVIYQNGSGVPVALGLSALRYADEPTAARGHSDRYGAFTRDFIMAGLGKLAKAERVTINRLAVLLPERHHKASVIESISRALMGEHTFSLNGKQRAVKVLRVVPIKEGEAAWHYLAPRHAGNTISIDGGGGTTNVAWGVRGKFVDVKTRDTGLQRAWDQLDAQLRTERDGRALTMLERYELERALVAGEQFHIVTHSGKGLRVDDKARAWFAPVAAFIAADIKEGIGAWRSSEAIYYSGGQVLHLGPAMQEEFEGRLTLAKSPVEPNIRGALTMLGAKAEEAQDVNA